MVLVGPRIRAFDGTLLGGGSSWDVQMTKVASTAASCSCARSAERAEQRKKQIARGAAGALRILAA